MKFILGMILGAMVGVLYMACVVAGDDEDD